MRQRKNYITKLATVLLSEDGKSLRGALCKRIS